MKGYHGMRYQGPKMVAFKPYDTIDEDRFLPNIVSAGREKPLFGPSRSKRNSG
jgi:hypothetical protein